MKIIINSIEIINIDVSTLDDENRYLTGKIKYHYTLFLHNNIINGIYTDKYSDNINIPFIINCIERTFIKP